MTAQLRLPDQTYTDDVGKFVTEWDKVRKPLEQLGFRVVAFDPGVSLCDAASGGGYFEIPLYAVTRFLEALRGVQHLNEEVRSDY